MKKEHEVNNLLLFMQETAGAETAGKEEAILKAYQKAYANKSGISIKVLTIVGGLLANLFFLGFLFLIDVADSPATMLLLGFSFIAKSIFLCKKFEQAFLDTLAVTIYASGLCMVAWGLLQGNASENLAYVLLMIIGAVSLFLFDNYILCFLSALVVTTCLLCLLSNTKANFMVPVYTALMAVAYTAWLKWEAELITTHKKLATLYNPVRLALTCSLLGACYYITTRFWIGYFSIHLYLIPSLVMIAAILYALPAILRTLAITQSRQKIMAYAGVVLLLAPTVYAPAISGALLIMTWSFLVNYKTGFVVGIIGLVYFIAQYYYDLQFTLLTKSLWMMTSGGVFILLYLLLHQSFGQHEKE